MSRDILTGNACFLVKFEDSEETKNSFISYLENEGFRKTISTYNTSHSNWLFINVNSMVFGSGYWKPVKLTRTIVGEDPPNAFSIDEFKRIWNILRKHQDFEKAEKIDISMVSYGNSSFLIKENIDTDSENNFWNYLKIHRFEAIDKFPRNWGYTLVNVDSMLFTTSTHIISPYIANLPDDALSADEFKAIWEIIMKHKGDLWNIDNYIDDCRSLYNRNSYEKVVETSKKIIELDKGNELAYEYMISSLFNLRKYEEALGYLKEAIRINPDNYKLYNIKAFILTDLYRIDEAITCYNKSFILGGFDYEDSQVSQYRAKCYLKKAKNQYYIENNKSEALKSLKVYINEFPKDEKALKLKNILAQDNSPFDYAGKLLYLETKAEELYSYGCLKESHNCYEDVLKASIDFRNNVPNMNYIGYDFVNRCNVNELENFRWYDEFLLKNLHEFNGNDIEFFNEIYEISEDTVDFCLDKAKLFSKVYDKDLTVKYVEKLYKLCPTNVDVKKFHDRILHVNNMYEVADSCDEFKDYSSLEEYVEDLILCIVASFTYYDEEGARKEVERSMDYVREAYDKQLPAGEAAYDFAIFP